MFKNENAKDTGKKSVAPSKMLPTAQRTKFYSQAMPSQQNAQAE